MYIHTYSMHIMCIYIYIYICREREISILLNMLVVELVDYLEYNILMIIILILLIHRERRRAAGRTGTRGLLFYMYNSHIHIYTVSYVNSYIHISHMFLYVNPEVYGPAASCPFASLDLVMYTGLRDAVYLSIYIFVYLSIYLSIYMFIYLGGDGEVPAEPPALPALLRAPPRHRPRRRDARGAAD